MLDIRQTEEDSLASFDIGAKLRQGRVGQGLSLDDISRETRIVTRFLKGIEANDFSDLPGLVFTRSFVRQYALALKLDPDGLLAELPTQDESTVQLPNPPVFPRSSYQTDRMVHVILSSAAWMLVGVAGFGAYIYFNRVAPPNPTTDQAPPTNAAIATRLPVTNLQARQPAIQEPGSVIPGSLPGAAVQVSLTAHEATWIQVSADGKTTFTGTLQSNETKQVSAAEQVRVWTGNAGALTISLNGRTLGSIGPVGEVRAVKLTAEGSQLLTKDPRSAPDPL